MLLRHLTLQDFRNVTLADVAFKGRRQFFSGPNGQGKTNLLEAAGFLTALRSFRTTDSRLLIRHGQPEAAVSCELEREGMGAARVLVKLRRDGRELWWDGERVGRLADHLGKFPTVVFSSEDLLLVRGPPAGRRRWLDLTLSAMDPAYLRALQTYGRALAGRNRLLRANGGGDARQLSAFEQLLAPAGAEIIACRAAGLRELAARLGAAYARLSDGAEEALLAYAPVSEAASAEDLRLRFEAGRARDAQFGATLTGPHRDDLRIEIRGAAAKDFGSEGQQRCVVLALRLAQASWFRERSGTRPVLLADDVLGELDPGRRHRFWEAIDPESQMIATGTGRPDPTLGDWQVFSVAGGRFSEDAPGMGSAA